MTFFRRLKSKTVPVSADLFYIADSENGLMLRQITFAQLQSAIGSGSLSFTSLTDVPSSYSGQGLKVLRVNSGETGIEFATISGSGLTQQQVEGLK